MLSYKLVLKSLHGNLSLLLLRIVRKISFDLLEDRFQAFLCVWCTHSYNVDVECVWCTQFNSSSWLKLRRLCASMMNFSPSLGLCMIRWSLTIVVSMESNTPHIVPVSEYKLVRMIVKTIGSSQQSKVLMYCCSSVDLRLMMSAM